MLSDYSDEKIVSLLNEHSLLAKEACKEILKRPKDFIPRLLNVLDKAINNPPLDDESEDSEIYVPSAFILAQLKEKAAYEKILKLMSFDDDDMKILWGDMLRDYCKTLLRDTFNGDAALIPAFLEKHSVSPWSRVAALHAFTAHYSDGLISRDETIAAFRHLIHDVCKKDSENNGIILSHLVEIISDNNFEELLPDAKSLFSRDEVDSWLPFDDEMYAADFGKSSYTNPKEHMDNAIRELEEWGWFDESTSNEDDDEDFSGGTYTRTEPKVGRNDPCPCGSGKKYKQCCGR